MVYSEVMYLYFIHSLIFGIIYDTMPFYYYGWKEQRVVPLEFLGSAFFRVCPG